MFFLWIPFYLQAVQIHSANGTNSLQMILWLLKNLTNINLFWILKTMFLESWRACLMPLHVLSFCLESYRKQPPLWSSGQSSWLHIQRSGFDSRCYQIFWEVLRLVSTIEELLLRKVAVPVQKTGITAIGIHRADYMSPLYPQLLELTSPTIGGHSVGILHSWTKAMEFIIYHTGNTRSHHPLQLNQARNDYHPHIG
jgi:hypothetical protein